MVIKVVVTGGAGFIGRNLVEALNEAGEERVLVVDALGKDEKWKNLRGLRFEDYLDRGVFLERMLAGEFEGVETVFHLGACSATTETDTNYLMENNYRYTRRLAEWCLARGVRFVFASSAATYGDGALGYSDDDGVTRTLRPLNMYGYSKHMFDLWALRHGLFDQIVGLKYFNVYGPGEAHKADMRSVVHKAFGQIKTVGSVQLFRSNHPDYGDGEQMRDFIYVKDVVKMTAWFHGQRDASGLFNCGTGQARTWLDLVSAVFQALGREPNIQFVDMPKSLSAKYQNFTEAEMGKMRAAGYGEEFTSLEDGVADYVQNYLVNED